jgi:hypothetical protein
MGSTPVASLNIEANIQGTNYQYLDPDLFFRDQVVSFQEYVVI